jgi:AcrR family transcriptional regulator
MPRLFPGYRDAIRNSIIREAFTIFIEKGFEKTTMDDIATALGVTKPAIYRYFSNKEALFLASTSETMIIEFKKVFVTSFESSDLIAGADRFFDELLAFHRKYAAIGKDVEQIVARSPALQRNLAALHAEGLEFLQQFFEEQKRKGKIRTPIHEGDLARICSALAQGLSSGVGLGSDTAEAKRLWLLGLRHLAGVVGNRNEGMGAPNENE